MRFEFVITIHFLNTALGTLALAYYFDKFVERKYKKKLVYIFLYALFFCISFLLSAFVSDVWSRSIVGLAFPFFAALTFYKGRIIKRLFFAELVLVLQMTTEPLVAVLLAWTTGRIFPEIPAEDTVYFIGVGLSTFLFLIAVGILTYRSNKPKSEAVTSHQYIVLSIMIGLCMFISYVGLWTILRSGMTIEFVHVILELCVFSMPIFIFLVFERFQEHAHAVMHAKVLAAQLAQNEQQFELMETHQIEIRKLKHDFAGQLMAMRSMVDRAACSELIGYLDNFSDSVEGTLEKTITGLSSIDAVIALKKSEAEGLGISFELRTPAISEIKVNPVHLNNILINALNNAIEACAALPDGAERRIELGLKTEEEYVFVRVVNTALPVTIEEGAFPTTTKPDKTSHGIGLESISNSVRKNSGIMSIDYDSGSFFLLIRLNNDRPGDSAGHMEI